MSYRRSIFLLLCIICWNTIYSMDNKTVSYIYYPSGNVAPLGHAQLEINGEVWDLLTGDCLSEISSRSLEDSIKRAKKGGIPFFRFVFGVYEHQINNLLQAMESPRNEWNCSYAIIRLLSAEGICSVPVPLSISPLLTATYLTSGKCMKLNGVKKIEYYGNKSHLVSGSQILPGSIFETAGIAGCIAILCRLGCFAGQYVD